MNNTSMPSLSIGAIEYIACESFDAYKDWAEPLGIDIAFQEKMRHYGVGKFSRTDERNSAGLAIDVTAKLLVNNNINVNDIDLIIYFHTQQTSSSPPPVSIINHVRSEFGIKADGFSLSQQRCTSFYMILSLLKNMFSNRTELNNVLVVSADIVYSEWHRNLDAVDIESDGAVAALIHRGDFGTKVLSSEALVQGSYYQQRTRNEKEEIHYRMTATMANRQIISRAMDKAGVKPEDIDLLIPYTGNYPYWEQIAKGLNISPEIIFTDNISTIGHIYGCDGLINLKTCRDKGLVKPGDHLVMTTLAYGRSFACAVVRV